MTKITTFIKVADSFKAVGNKIKNLFTKKQNLGRVSTQFINNISINYIDDGKQQYFTIVDDGKIVQGCQSYSYSDLFNRVAKYFESININIKDVVIYSR